MGEDYKPPTNRELARAYDAQEKKALVARLLSVWLANPYQRLGQLIVNALPPERCNDAFYIEDYELIERLERM